MSQEIVMSVRSISKQFPGVKALSDCSLDFYKGEVHAIVGENGAGKSTLMNIISGSMMPNSGELLVEGTCVDFVSPKDAQRYGIAIVHQEMANCSTISVAENIFMSSVDDGKSLFVNFKKLNAAAENLLNSFDAKINPRSKMRELKVSDQQIVEIVKAIKMNCKVIIFDEPTAAITEKETEILFNIIKDLKKKGISIIYISHRMEEVFGNCDRISVLKDGYLVGTKSIQETDRSSIISMMVGREIGKLYPDKAEPARGERELLLEVQKFSSRGVFKDVSFKVKKGEILGFSGLIGSGRSELMRAVCGIDKWDSGAVYLNGKKVAFRNYADAIRHGVVYLTEDRKTLGLMLNLDIAKNISAFNLNLVSNGLFISSMKETKQSKVYCKELDIKCVGIGQKVGTLSGGNQQKVLISKLLTVKPEIIIMDEPTRGIDVGAKSEIHKMMRELANQGVGIIMISSELPEIIGLCDKVMVIREGQVRAELSGDEINEVTIIHKASGY